jgi:hypothetical protein
VRVTPTLIVSDQSADDFSFELGRIFVIASEFGPNSRRRQPAS